MFDISWGETFVIIGVSVYFIGSKDLPRASRFVGTQVGRAVGLLQGARVRADRFAAQSELRALQNELRSGLRELDQVRSEMAVAVTSQGMVGRTLGATVPGANRGQVAPTGIPRIDSTIPSTPVPPVASAPSPEGSPPQQPQETIHQIRELAPRSQAVAAIAEEEWQKQGIGFQSQAERGLGDATGSAMLSNLYQQTLIYDQHDRVVAEQDDALRARIESKQKDKDTPR